MLPRPTGIDVIASTLLGVDDPARELPPPGPGGLREALERSILPALRRPPCGVSFSGGRDSSAILAVAVAVARRHGLADPIPVTMRFPGALGADEDSWQHLVLGHLGLRNQEVLLPARDIDALGPVATKVLTHQGGHWPANAYMHGPMLEAVPGGTLLTGVGGDELLGTSAGRRTMLLVRRRRPGLRDWGSLAAGVAPTAVRAAVWRRRNGAQADHRWLTAAGRRALLRALARESSSWPDSWDGALRHWYRTRAFTSVGGSLGMVAAVLGGRIDNPFLEPEVLAAAARAGGRTGWPAREQAMRELFGDLLPERILVRGTKAEFSAPFWGPAARAFATGWDGTGVDGELVDIDRLRQEWLSEKPDFRTALLLQQAWLATVTPASRGAGSSTPRAG